MRGGVTVFDDIYHARIIRGAHKRHITKFEFDSRILDSRHMYAALCEGMCYLEDNINDLDMGLMAVPSLYGSCVPRLYGSFDPNNFLQTSSISGTPARAGPAVCGPVCAHRWPLGLDIPLQHSP